MRNLKRALSLALASVMLLGMMVVGTSAASYPDVDENDNVEAIEVLNAVNVMIGRQGNFEPDEAVNRHEMAVIMAKLVLGVDTADNYVGTHPFTDVVPWADKYVAACYENGLVAGTSATTFSGGKNLTAVEAAAMMLRALGYKDLSVGATDWRAPVTAMANQIRLFNGVASNPSQQLNRNQVAQLALNTLKSPMVNLVDNTITWNSNEGQVIMASGGRQYIALSSREAYARAINRVESAGTSASQIGGWTVELGEHLYNGDLKLNDVTDPFQRPARQWEYDGKEIGTYIKEELLDFQKVGEVTGKDLYDVLGKTAIDEYTMIVALDGVTDPVTVREVRKYDGNKESLGAKHNQDFVFDAADLNRSNKGSVGATGTGVLTQVFVDPNYDNGGSAKDGRIWIAVINTYLARATQDYDSRREELALNAYSVTKNRGEFVALDKDGAAETVRLGVEEYPVVKDADKDDAFLVTFAEGEVQTIVPAEVMEAVTISSFKKDSNVVVDGTKYNFTTTAGFDAKTLKAYTGDAVTNLKDSTYNVFLDAYGNTIGVQEVDAKKNYVFLAAIDINDSNLVNGTADAKAVFLDGTVDTIRVNLDKSDLDYYTKNAKPGGYNKNSILNTWCTYTVNNSNVYTVKQVMDINAKGDTFVPDYTWTNDKGEKVNNNDTGLAQYHQTGFTAANEKIDKKHITLQGNTTNTGSYARVYGNEKTVYLNAELTNLTNQGGIWGVVKDVDSVTTGAENVNLTVWSDTVAKEAAETTTIKLDGLDYATKGVYTLYDDDGIVIAAVVAGEDDGSARNLVYVHSSDIDSESYNGNSASRAAGDGLWTWTRKVIRNGEEVTLTEVSDGNSELDLMKQYHWYQIKTNADGEVTGVYELPDDDLTKLKEANLARYKDYALTYKNGGNKTDNIGEIAYTVQKGASTVLYWNQDYIKSRLLMNGRTLYVATDDQTGFIVNSNVKWVVQQWDNNKKETYIDDGTTAAGLKNMIDEINRRNTKDEVEYNYTYQVSAVIESGIASSVIIYFNENDYNRPDGGRPTGTTTLKWDRISEKWTLTVPVDDDKVGDLTTTQIRNYLIDAGCKDVSKTRDGWNFTIDSTEYIDQVVKVVGQTPATKYAIDIAASTNGTVTADVASAAEGATVTLTVTPDKGYKLATLTVTDAAGKEVTVNKDNTFKMPGKAVTVKATFVSDDPDTVSVINNVPGAYAVLQSDTSKIATSAKKGDKITLVPSIAVKFTAGVSATPDADGWYTVTGDEDVTYAVKSSDAEGAWYFDGTRWVGVNGTRPAYYPAGPLYTGIASVARFSLARAVVNDNDWLDEAMKDTANTYTITVGSYSWTGASVPGEGPLDPRGFELTPDANSDTATAALAFVKAYVHNDNPAMYPDALPMDVTKTEGGATETDKVVVEREKNVMTLYVYDPENNEAKEAEIKGAIIKALKDAKPGLKAEDIEIKGTAVTIGTDSYTLSSAQPLYKVTVGNSIQYVKDGGKVTGLGTAVKALLPKADRVGNDGIVVNKGEFVFEHDGSEDIDFEYAPALAVDATTLGTLETPGSNGEKYTVYYEKKAKGSNEWDTLSGNAYIQSGVGMWITGENLTEGTTVKVTVNGQAFTQTVGAGKDVDLKILNGFTAYAKNETTGKDEAAIKFSASDVSGQMYTIYWDGKVVGGAGKQWEIGKPISLDGVTADGNETYIIGRVAANGGNLVIDGPSKAPGAKTITLTTANVAAISGSTDPQAAKDLAKGIIRINTAYQVTVGSDYAIAAVKAASADDQLTIATTNWVAKDTKLTITAAAANALLEPKTNSKWTVAELEKDMTAPINNTKAGADQYKAIYEVAVTKTIGADEFEANKTIASGVSVTPINLGTGVIGDNGEAVFAVAKDQKFVNATTASKVKHLYKDKDTVTAEWVDSATSSALNKLTPTVEITTDSTEATGDDAVITLTLTNTTGAKQDLVVPETTGLAGVVEITVNGKMSFTVNVTVADAQAAPTGLTKGTDPVKTLSGTQAKAQVAGATAASGWTVKSQWFKGDRALTEVTDGTTIEFDVKDLSLGKHEIRCDVWQEKDETVSYSKTFDFTVVIFPTQANTINETGKKASLTDGTAVDTGVVVTIPDGFTATYACEGDVSAAAVGADGKLTVTVANDTNAGKVTVTLKLGNVEQAYTAIDLVTSA